MQDLMNLKYSQWPLKVFSLSEMKARQEEKKGAGLNEN